MKKKWEEPIIGILNQNGIQSIDYTNPKVMGQSDSDESDDNPECYFMPCACGDCGRN